MNREPPPDGERGDILRPHDLGRSDWIIRITLVLLIAVGVATQLDSAITEPLAQSLGASAK